jgi:hypothetical protein
MTVRPGPCAADLIDTPLESLVLERHLRETYRDSPHPHERLKYAGMPLYLQDLLWHSSHEYAHSPDNIDRLLSSLLTLPDVVFVSLNYDTILDDRLDTFSKMEHISDYIVRVGGRNWSLVKLHGSVNWGQAVGRGYDGMELQLPLELGQAIVLRGVVETIDAMRFTDPLVNGRALQGEVYFPALSVPIGSDDELVCPPGPCRFPSQPARPAIPRHRSPRHRLQRQ